MDEDAIVKSIGMGNTDRLSSLNGLRQVPKDQEEDPSSNLKPPKLNIKVYKSKIKTNTDNQNFRRLILSLKL